MSAKSSIQVCIKLRPCEPELSTLWQVKDRNSIQLIDSQSDPCVFDYVFDQDCNNQEVFDCMAKHIVEACIKGFNGTIFAYGQTSSGKTYTMMGDRENPGVMVLAAKEIFKQIAKNSDRDFLLRVGYIEIYNEKIFDLLNKKNQDLKIHESNGMVNVNCEECIITSEEDLLKFLSLGNKERTVGETNMNERSSRSHAIFRIIIESRKTDRTEDDAVIQSLLNLVDLAGSERADQTGARGARLKEGSHINKSLHFLSNVIKSLSENEDNKYVSFRDSKLTRILQASLGGNAFTSIICNVRPSIMDESQSTLNFAMRAKKIRLKPQLNEIVSDATMMKRLEREIKDLKDRLAEEQARNESQLKVRLLEQRIKTDTLKIITSNTITDKRKNRRRTWCPATSNPETTGGVETSNSEPSGSNVANGVQLKHSNLPKPSFYPSAGCHISQRAINAPKTINIMKSLDVAEEEEFKPAEKYDFGEVPPSAMITSRILPPLTLTPRLAELGAKSKEMLERDLVELHTFTKMEKHFDTEWNVLNEKFAAATAQIEELQAERQSVLQRSESLEAQVNALTAAKLEADEKIAKYEEEVKTLKETVQRMDMENRAAVELEFQFESHKSKTKRRETELLTALSEKDIAFENLQKKLNDLSRDVLQNSKEELMRSICPGIENNCEQICKKCADLERLLEEYNSKDKSNAQAIDCECEQLRADIARTREQLEQVQAAYQQMSSDVSEKSELCDRLSRDVILAEQAKAALRAQYEDLEQRQGVMISNIQTEYDLIQQKYQKLQQDYELLQQATAASEEQQKKLQAENEHLQKEIEGFKQTVEEMQQQLLKSADNDVQQEQLLQLRTSNEQVMTQLSEMKEKYGELQAEYDDLSNQLMESVQDGDSLREECHKLREQLKNPPQNDHAKLKAYITQLEAEVAEKNQLIESTERTMHEWREQMQSLESALLEKSVIVNKVEDYQRQLESLEKQHADLTIVCEELQEKVKENTLNESQYSTSTLLMPSDSDQENEQLQEMQRLRERIGELDKQVLGLQAEVKEQLALVQQKDELISKLQDELQEFNERCISMDMEQMELRSSAQQQQQLLDRQADKLKDDASRIDQLQAHNAQLNERSTKAEADYKERLESIHKEFELKEKQQKELVDSLQLDYLQKIEERENESRETLRKYNNEWADRLQKQVVTTEEELGEKNAQMHELIREKHELESLYDESEKLVKQLREQLGSKQHSEETAGRLEGLQEKCEQQVREYEQLKHDYEQNLDKLKQEKSALQLVVDENTLVIEELNQQLQSEQNQMQQLRDELAVDARVKTEFGEQVENLNSKLRDLQAQLQLGQSAIDESKMEIERLQQQLQEASSQCTTEAIAKEEALKQVESLKITLETQREDLNLGQNSLQTKLEKLSEQLQAEQEKCAEAREELEAGAAAKAELVKQVESLECALKAQQDALSSENTSLQSVIDSLKQELKEVQEERDTLCVKLTAYAAAKAELVEQIETLKSALNSQQDELNKSLQSSIDILKQELKEEREELEKRSAQLADEVTAKIELIKQMEELNSKHAELCSANTSLQSTVDGLKQQLDEQQEQREKICAELEAENVEKLKLVQQMNNELSLATNSLHSTIDSLKEELREKQEECKKISDQLAIELKSKVEHAQQTKSFIATIMELKEKHQHSGDSLQAEIDQLKQELQAEQENRKRLTDEAAATTSDLLEQVKRLSLQIDTQKEELNLGSDSLKSIMAEKNTQIELLNQELQAEKEKCRKQNDELRTKWAAETNDLNSKIERLQLDVEQSKLQAGNYQQLVAEHENLKATLSETYEANKNLTEKTEQVQSTLLLAQTELTTQRVQVSKLQSELDAILAEMSEQARQFEQQIKELNGSKDELNHKLAALLKHKLELEETNHQLTVKLKNELNLQNLLDKEREQSANLAHDKVQLQLQLKTKEEACNKLQQEFGSGLAAAAAEANRKSVELGNQVTLLQADIEKLKCQLKTNKDNFDASRERLDATISSLLEDKRNLEEKLCVTNEIVKKLEADVRAKGNNSNLSFESNASSTSPSSRKSLDREPPQPRKSLNIESEVRRNRRISTHDERRRQSYWNDSRHVSCMTDPVDDNCNCAELDRKLKECQYELFIRESKVTALNIELKNHPLKEENAQLKKRLQEEQQRAREELKRIRYKNLDLMSKMNSFTASAAISNNSSPDASKPVATVETQTESLIEEELKKTNDKLQDCMQICRHRFNHIKQLEEKLKQNENNDTSNITSLTTGHINLLKAKLETQKKEINNLTNKYEYAKKALRLRKDEIDELRRLAGTDPTASST